MKWGALSVIFTASMIKFMFAPLGGPALQLNFIETYLACTIGATVASAIFFFPSNFFIQRSINKRKEKERKLLEKGLKIKDKKKFTLVNKMVIRMKRSVGIVGMSFLAPLFLSIPLGSIIVAKFYGSRPMAYPLILLGIFVNGLITTSLTYFFFT